MDQQEAEPPRTIAAAAFQPERLDRLTSRLSAAYKGINVLVLRAGAADFFWKANIRELDAEDVALDMHHIFPQDWCDKQGILRKHYNAIVNKTPISYKANRMIGGAAPSHYLQKLQNHQQVQLDVSGMNTILESHLIPADTLRADDFQTFYTLRKQALLTLIEGAMGKNVMPANVYEEVDEGEEQTAFLELRAAG